MEAQAYKILIAATGSVAALKIPSLIRTILELPPSATNNVFEVKLVVTKSAKRYIKTDNLPPEIKMYDDKHTWESWHQKGDPILHTDLARQANMLLIAPLDAKTLAKIAQGLCDNLLTTTVRSWSLDKPVVFCPSMTTTLWEHPVTEHHVDTLKEWGFIEIPPVSTTMECGTTGVDAMADIETIANTILKIANKESNVE